MLRRGATARLRPPAQTARLKATQKNRHPYDLSLTDASLFSGPAHSWVSKRQYCAKIDEAARNRMELIVPELVKRNGVTEQLKAENQMEWVRQMNACKAQAEEIVKAELIYD